MKSICKMVFLVSIFQGTAVSGDVGTDAAMLTCEGPTCGRVAEKAEYEYKVPAAAIAIKTEHFSLEAPEKPIRKIITSSEDLIIQYADEKLLYISESSGPKIDQLSTDLAHRYPEIVFLKTPSDPIPDSPPEKLFWETAIASKPFYFQGATEASFSKKDDLTYYYSDTHELGFSARGMVVNAQYNDIYLVIEAKGIDLDTFKQVVYSVK